MSEKRTRAKLATVAVGLNGHRLPAPLQSFSARPAKVVDVSSVENNRSNVSDAVFYLAAMTYFFSDVPKAGRGQER